MLWLLFPAPLYTPGVYHLPLSGSFHWNPESGLFNPFGTFDDTREYTFSELSGENYEFSIGHQLVPIDAGQLYQQGGGEEVIYLGYGNGYGELITEMLSRPRNLFTAEDATYGIQGTINARLPSGEIRQIEIEAADLYRRGETVYTYTGDAGEREFFTGVAGAQTTQIRLEAIGGDVRVASTNEVIEYATRGYLANNEQEFLAEFAGVEPNDMSDSGRQSRYDAARQLAQLSISGLSFFKTHVVGFSDRERARG